MDAEAVLQEWHARSGAYSPGYYAYVGPDGASESIHEVLDARLDPDAAIIELGCSAGRHLSTLYDHGYRNLSGVDINRDAFAVMAESYPGLADAGTFYRDAIERVVPGFDDGRFDAVYTVETFQHIHRDNTWIFAEVARVAGDLLVTVELEGDGESTPATDPTMDYVDDAFPLYYRDWRHVFTGLGFEEVDSEPLGDDTLRVFRATDGDRP